MSFVSRSELRVNNTGSVLHKKIHPKISLGPLMKLGLKFMQWLIYETEIRDLFNLIYDS